MELAKIKGLKIGFKIGKMLIKGIKKPSASN